MVDRKGPDWLLWSARKHTDEKVNEKLVEVFTKPEIIFISSVSCSIQNIPLAHPVVDDWVDSTIGLERIF